MSVHSSIKVCHVVAPCIELVCQGTFSFKSLRESDRSFVLMGLFPYVLEFAKQYTND